LIERNYLTQFNLKEFKLPLNEGILLRILHPQMVDIDEFLLQHFLHRLDLLKGDVGVEELIRFHLPLDNLIDKVIDNTEGG